MLEQMYFLYLLTFTNIFKVKYLVFGYGFYTHARVQVTVK